MNAAKQEVVDFVEQYFIDDGEASINDCVRDALALRIPVTPAQVSSIRSHLRQRQMRTPPALVLVPAPQTPKAYKPHWPSDKPPPAPLVVDIPAPPETKEEKKKFASIEERRFFYETVLLENPGITVVKAMKMVKEKFGRSVDPGYAVTSLRIARALHQEPNAEQPKVELPLTIELPAHPAPPLAQENKVTPPKSKPNEEAGEYLLLYKLAQSNSSWETIMTTKEELTKRMEELVNKGIKAESIKVYKSVKAKARVVIDFD